MQDTEPQHFLEDNEKFDVRKLLSMLSADSADDDVGMTPGVSCGISSNPCDSTPPSSNFREASSDHVDVDWSTAHIKLQPHALSQDVASLKLQDDHTASSNRPAPLTHFVVVDNSKSTGGEAPTGTVVVSADEEIDDEVANNLISYAISAGWTYYDPSAPRAVVHIPAHLKDQRRLAKIFIGQIPKDWSADFLLQLIHEVAGIPVYRDMQICNARNSRYGCTKLFVEESQAHRLLCLNQRIEVREDAYRVLEEGESPKKGAGLLVVELSTAQHCGAGSVGGGGMQAQGRREFQPPPFYPMGYPPPPPPMNPRMAYECMSWGYPNPGGPMPLFAPPPPPPRGPPPSHW